jgi:ParB-like chromosome segregation protein Spo0J
VYHVMDGHHRFLAALKLKRDTIKANVYTEWSWKS